MSALENRSEILPHRIRPAAATEELRSQHKGPFSLPTIYNTPHSRVPVQRLLGGTTRRPARMRTRVREEILWKLPREESRSNYCLLSDQDLDASRVRDQQTKFAMRAVCRVCEAFANADNSKRPPSGPSNIMQIVPAARRTLRRSPRQT